MRIKISLFFVLWFVAVFYVEPWNAYVHALVFTLTAASYIYGLRFISSLMNTPRADQNKVSKVSNKETSVKNSDFDLFPFFHSSNLNNSISSIWD